MARVQVESDRVNYVYSYRIQIAITICSLFIRGCQRCNFVLQGALIFLNLKCQVAEHVV